MFHKSNWMILVLVAGLMVGCNQSTRKVSSVKAGQKSEPQAQEHKIDPQVAIAGKKYLLPVEPADAKGVLELRKQSKDGDDVVMVARIAGSKKPFVEGRASFTVTDLSIQPCEDSDTPWECCCTPKEILLGASAQVRFVGDDGKTLSVSAKDLVGVKELTIVVVTGKASRDDKGNLTIVASSLFSRLDKE